MPPQSIGRRTLRELKISRYMIGGVDMQLALMVLLVGLALGQTPAGESVRGTLVFSHTGTELEVQTIAKIVQQTAAIRDLSVDSATGTLTLSGTSDQMALAEWLFRSEERRVGKEGR